MLCKVGTYLVSHYGVTTTVGVAVTASAVTGTALAVNAAANKVHNGYCLIVEGLTHRSYAKFFEGVHQLVKAGMSAQTIIDDFDDFVDALDCDYRDKVLLKNTMKGLDGLVTYQVEQKTITLIKKAEYLLRDSHYSKELYIDQVNAIYYKHTCDLSDDYTELLGRAGRIYSDMCDLNVLSGIRNRYTREYDHYLVYCIAGWMKDHLSLDCLNGKSQRWIADDITNHILEYLETIN